MRTKFYSNWKIYDWMDFKIIDFGVIPFITADLRKTLKINFSGYKIAS